MLIFLAQHCAFLFALWIRARRVPNPGSRYGAYTTTYAASAPIKPDTALQTVQIPTRYPPADTCDFVERLTAELKTRGKSGLWSDVSFGDVHAVSRNAVAIRKMEMETEMERIVKMGNQETRKCAHIPCLCDVEDGQEYCGETCRDAGSQDGEIACQCDH